MQSLPPHEPEGLPEGLTREEKQEDRRELAEVRRARRDALERLNVATRFIDLLAKANRKDNDLPHD